MKKLIVLSIFAVSTLLTATTFAAPAEKYKCQLIIASPELAADKGNWEFEVGATGATHGSGGLTFKGGTHEVYVAADSHWLTVEWNNAGKTIARGLFAISPTDTAENRVAILYQPDDSGNQVSVGCNAVR